MITKAVGAWPTTLRTWQREAHIKFTQADGADFTCVVTPGGGKTLFALYCAHALFEMEAIERVIIVVPTEHLKKQWRDRAHEVGLSLMAEFRNEDAAIGSQFHGCVVTYQQVAAKPKLFARLTTQVPTFAVLDEIHHAGETRSWSAGLRMAFEDAYRRLLLSGTLFRSDNFQIPFVRYENGKSYADYPYGYSEALRDLIVPSVIFPHYEGRVEFLDRDGGVKSLILGDEVSERLASIRLRMALSMKGQWLPSVLKEANDRLSEIRRTGHLDAGGLILAMDRDHALSIQEPLAKIAGEEPCVVYSEDPEAKERIEWFKKGRTRWIIAIRMVSEGVDIPRLRVGVYATNVVTELFFRQAIGRLLRLADGQDDQVGEWFLPNEARLIGNAEQFKIERDHQITEGEEEPCGRERGERATFAVPQLVGTSDSTRVGIIEDGTSFSEWEVSRAELKCQDIGLPVFHAPALIRAYRAGKLQIPEWEFMQKPAEKMIPTETLEERCKRLRTKAHKKVHILADRTGEKHSLINQALNDRIGLRDVRESTEDQLVERNRILDEWLDKRGR